MNKWKRKKDDQQNQKKSIRNTNPMTSMQNQNLTEEKLKSLKKPIRKISDPKQGPLFFRIINKDYNGRKETTMIILFIILIKIVLFIISILLLIGFVISLITGLII